MTSCILHVQSCHVQILAHQFKCVRHPWCKHWYASGTTNVKSLYIYIWNNSTAEGLPVWLCWGQICNFWPFFNRQIHKFTNGVSFVLFMYKICEYCLFKARSGVLKASLCIYILFVFFRCHLAFFKGWSGFLAYENLATLHSGPFQDSTLEPGTCHVCCVISNSVTFQAIELQSCSKDSASLLVRI